MTKWVVGIDPGLGETGLVLYPDNDIQGITAWRTYTSPHTKEPLIARILSISGAIIDTLVEWVDTYDIKLLDVGLETPIYARGRVYAFQAQWRTVQEIESGLAYRLAGELVECWVTEVSPTTSKALATGSGKADKPEMLAASPFAGMSYRADTLYALADAWAHGLSAWGTKGKRLNYAALTAATTKRVV